MARLPVGIYQDTAKRITCVFCGLSRKAFSDQLCEHCAADTFGIQEQARDMVKMLYADQDMAWKYLRHSTEAADDRLSQRWQTFMDAATLDPDKHASAKRIARSGRVDPLMDLIRLYCQWEDAQAVYEERQAWAERVYQAIGELDRQNKPRPHEYFVSLGESRRTAKCRSCGAAICWKTTISGAQVPLSLATLIDRDGELFALSHFTDCPQASAWSKGA